MNQELWGEVANRAETDLDGVTSDLVERLAGSDESPFSSAAVSSFNNSPNEVHAWLAKMSRLLADRIDLKLIYVEMNGFDINYDRWFCDSFGFSRVIDHQEVEELSAFEAFLHYREGLTLKGMEPMQAAFGWWAEETGHDDQFAEVAELAILLVQCRFLALIREGVVAGSLTPNVPVAAAVHDSDLVLRFDPR